MQIRNVQTTQSSDTDLLHYYDSAAARDITVHHAPLPSAIGARTNSPG